MVANKKIIRKPRKRARPLTNEEAHRRASVEFDPHSTSFEEKYSYPEIQSMVWAAEHSGKKGVKTWFWIDQLARWLLDEEHKNSYRPLAPRYRPELPFEKAYDKLRKFYRENHLDITSRMVELRKK